VKITKAATSNNAINSKILVLVIMVTTVGFGMQIKHQVVIIPPDETTLVMMILEAVDQEVEVFVFNSVILEIVVLVTVADLTTGMMVVRVVVIMVVQVVVIMAVQAVTTTVDQDLVVVITTTVDQDLVEEMMVVQKEFVTIFVIMETVVLETGVDLAMMRSYYTFFFFLSYFVGFLFVRFFLGVNSFLIYQNQAKKHKTIQSFTRLMFLFLNYYQQSKINFIIPESLSKKIIFC